MIQDPKKAKDVLKKKEDILPPGQVQVHVHIILWRIPNLGFLGKRLMD